MVLCYGSPCNLTQKARVLVQMVRPGESRVTAARGGWMGLEKDNWKRFRTTSTTLLRNGSFKMY